MMRTGTFNAIAAGLVAFAASMSSAAAADQAKTIVNAIDPKSLNELFDVARRQPDAALTNIAPVSANTFRFLFVWPASNPIVTYERVGRSFAERFAGFADRLKLLVTGFCLPSRNLFFGTATYGDEEVNVAYRDIEVHYKFGWQAPCTGRYISVSELEQSVPPAQTSGGYGGLLPRTPMMPPKQLPTPEDDLKPFLNPQPSAPLE